MSRPYRWRPSAVEAMPPMNAKGTPEARAAASVSSRMRRIHYAWVIAAVTWLTLLAAAGFRSTPSTLIVPLQQEFGWSRATISLAVSINLVMFGLFAPFAGGLMERFGVRRVTIGALLA